MPMEIGVPPFFQRDDDLPKRPSQKGRYFSIMTYGDLHWIEHNKVGVDGPARHQADKISGLLHVHLLSYERLSRSAHYGVNIL